MKKYLLLITGLLLAVTGLRAQTCTSTCPEKIYVRYSNEPTILDDVFPSSADKGVTYTYKLVETNLTGTTQCWLAQNLGSTAQAASSTDNTAPAAGWYWQFNRKQGYSYEGSRIPTTWSITGISGIDESSDWLPANDPCTLLLGSNWRLPTSTEWTNADANGPWGGSTTAYGSVLKLHTAGWLSYAAGALNERGTRGSYWSSTQSTSTYGNRLSFDSGSCTVDDRSKAYGMSVRCLMDL